ncbi:MAG: hypothetical protein ACTMH4_13470, partial [Sphingobacterium sp.]
LKDADNIVYALICIIFAIISYFADSWLSLGLQIIIIYILVVSNGLFRIKALKVNAKTSTLIAVTLSLFIISMLALVQNISFREKIEKKDVEISILLDTIDSLSSSKTKLISELSTIGTDLKYEDRIEKLSLLIKTDLSTRERQSLEQYLNEQIYLRSQDLLNAEDLDNALQDLDYLAKKNFKPREVYFLKGKIWHRKNNTFEAVKSLRAAISFGNNEAEEFHERINPIKKEIIGYVTRCCDGTTSQSKGRGTCSWHGGVCNWNEPIYQSYREY